MSKWYFNSNCDKDLSYQNGLTPLQQKDLTNFLSIGLGAPSRYRCKQLTIALQRKKEIKIMRTRVMKLMKPLLQNRRLLRKITLLLEKSGLSLSQQLTLLKRIRKLFLDFSRGVHNQLDLRGINLQRLPLSLRRFIIALQVLKAEIVHLFRLEIERDNRRRYIANAPKLSIENRRIDKPIIVDFRKLHSSGVSRTLGSYAGMIGMKRGKNYTRNVNNEQRTTTKTSKKTRNYYSNKTKTSQRYYSYNHNTYNEKSKRDKNTYYQTNINKKTY